MDASCTSATAPPHTMTATTIEHQSATEKLSSARGSSNRRAHQAHQRLDGNTPITYRTHPATNSLPPTVTFIRTQRTVVLMAYPSLHMAWTSFTETVAAIA